MSSRRILGTLAGVLVSIAFLGLALYRVDLNALGEALRSADYRLVLVSALFTFVSYIFRTARWRRLLRPQKQIPLARLYPVLIVGFALNNLMPGRPGEVARAISLGQREALPKTLGLATVIVERVADGLTLIAILAFISLGFDLPGWGREVESLSVAIFMVALAGLLFLLWREHLAMRLFKGLVRIVPESIGLRMGRMLSAFILGLHSLRSAGDVLAIALLSLGAWMCEAAHYYVMLAAFGLLPDSATHGFASAFTMVMVNLGISIPAAPGGVGPFEAAGVLALGAFGIARVQALTVVLVSHAVQYVLVSALGIFFIAREGLNLARAVGEEAAEGG